MTNSALNIYLLLVFYLPAGSPLSNSKIWWHEVMCIMKFSTEPFSGALDLRVGQLVNGRFEDKFTSSILKGSYRAKPTSRGESVMGYSAFGVTVLLVALMNMKKVN